MEKKNRERIESVLRILKNKVFLTAKQEKFCSDSCINRFLKASGDDAKKAAKNLIAALAWRKAIGTEHLMADEFSAELAEGAAYVSGKDDSGRPVLIFRLKQDYIKLHSQKSFVRLMAFTLEVAVSTMPRFVDQFVLLFDASFFRSASAFLNVLMCALKIVADYYPGSLHRAFAVDPPALFPFLWKGARPFVDLWASTSVISSRYFEDPPETEAFASRLRTTSLRFDQSPKLTADISSGSASSRFTFTASRLDSLKPWHLSMTTTTRAAVVPTSPSLAGASQLAARSQSFVLTAARSDKAVQPPRTPRPSFLQSPSLLFSRFKKGSPARNRAESFRPLLGFYRRPYDEMVYRGKMKPPLAGIMSIVSPRIKFQRRCSGGATNQLN